MLLLFLLGFTVMQVSGVRAAEQVADKVAKEQEVNFTAEDSFLLSGRYYSGAKNGAGVLLLHDCKHDSKSYQALSERLAASGIHALAMDFRGYGKSVSEEFSRQKIKTKTRNIVDYQNEISILMSYWSNDVLSAYHFLRSKVNRDKEVSVVASGCSAVQAVSLAEKMRVNSFVMISPQMNYVEKERFKNLFDIPAYFINSAQDLETHKISLELFNWNGDKRSKFQIFKGSRSAYSLLHHDDYLADDINYWISANFNN